MLKSIQEQIKGLITEESTIAIHTISGENAIDDAASILYKGLEQSHRTLGGLPGNFDIINNIEDISPNAYANDRNNNRIVVIVSIPEVIKDQNDEEWFIGIYPTYCQKYDKDVDTLPINKMIESDKKIPLEFITGLYLIKDDIESSEQVEQFIPNNKFIGILSKEEKANFFEGIKGRLIEYGLKKVTDQTSTYSSLDSYLGLSTYYSDQLNNYQNKPKKNK